MKLLVFGKTGQVAKELARHLPPDIDAEFLSRSDCDLEKPLDCAARIKQASADVIVNAAAWTAVDQAESEEVAATVVNGEAPGAMASAANECGIPLVHISTDYVFDGAGDYPFLPSAQTQPINAYGRSKLAGEVAIQASIARYAILRTSWVYSAHGKNFLKTMLRLGRERSDLNVVSDQVGGPTPAAAIAVALIEVARQLAAGHTGGVYHFSGTPDTTWASFAREIMRAANLTCDVHDVPTSSYPTPAKRPQNSRLDCTSLERDFGIQRPDWRGSLPDLISKIDAEHG